MNLMKLVSVAVLVLAFTGCGSSEAPPASAPAASAPTAGPDLCGLLTAEEIAEVMGAAPGETMSEEGGCSWAPPEGEDPIVQLRLSRSTLKSYDEFVAEYGREFGGENPSKEYYQPVEGLGSWALYRTSGDVLEVYTGDRMLAVSVSPASKERAIAVAGKALPRLP